MITPHIIPVLLPHSGTCTPGRLGAWDIRAKVLWTTPDSITLQPVAITDASDPLPIATGILARDDTGNLVLLNT